MIAPQSPKSAISRGSPNEMKLSTVVWRGEPRFGLIPWEAAQTAAPRESLEVIAHVQLASTNNIAQSTMSTEAHAGLQPHPPGKRKQVWFTASDSSWQFFTLFRQLQSNDALLLPLLAAWRTFSKDALASRTSGANTTLNGSWTPQIQQYHWTHHWLALRSEKLFAGYFFHDTHPANAHGQKSVAWTFWRAIFQHSSFIVQCNPAQPSFEYLLVTAKCQACSTSPKHPLSACLCLCACVPCCLCQMAQHLETADKWNGAVCSATYIGVHSAVNISFPVWVQDFRETNHLSDIMLSLSLHSACTFLFAWIVLKLQEQTSHATTYAAHAHCMSLFLHIIPMRQHRQAAHLFTWPWINTPEYLPIVTIC